MVGHMLHHGYGFALINDVGCLDDEFLRGCLELGKCQWLDFLQYVDYCSAGQSRLFHQFAYKVIPHILAHQFVYAVILCFTYFHGVACHQLLPAAYVFHRAGYHA